MVAALVVYGNSSVFYLSVVRILLVSKGDTGVYTSLFIAFSLLSLFFLYAFNVLHARYGYIWAFHIITLLNILFALASQGSLQFQIVAFCAFSLFRGLLFSTIMPLFGKIFGGKNASMTVGIAQTMWGITSLAVIHPLMLVGQEMNDLGDMLMIISGVSFVIMSPLIEVLRRWMAANHGQIPGLDASMRLQCATSATSATSASAIVKQDPAPGQMQRSSAQCVRSPSSSTASIQEGIELELHEGTEKGHAIVVTDDPADVPDNQRSLSINA